MTSTQRMRSGAPLNADETISGNCHAQERGEQSPHFSRHTLHPRARMSAEPCSTHTTHYPSCNASHAVPPSSIAPSPSVPPPSHASCALITSLTRSYGCGGGG